MQSTTRKSVLALSTALLFLLGSGIAAANPITGQINISPGFGDTIGIVTGLGDKNSDGNINLADATGITFADGMDGGDTLGEAGAVQNFTSGSSFDLAGTVSIGQEVVLANFTFDPSVSVDPLWSVGGFQFAASTFIITGQDANHLDLRGSGTLSGNGYDPTLGSWTFNMNTAGEASFNWSSTTVPEPATITLLGIGLLGMGLSRRRKTV